MKIKKLLSFILVMAMMLSVFVLPATAVNENEVVVHYYNENNWENPYIYYYNDGNTPVSWPGVAMHSDGDNWYSYTINNMGTAKVIFSNNGADQYPAQNQEGLTVSGEKWYKSGSFYSQNPDLSKITVHYYNTSAWSNPYIYYYTDNANPITWPGVAMTSDGNGWYSYDIYGYDSARVIFSNNGSNQNPGQNEPGYSVSGEKWYVNGSFYDSEPDGITVHFYNYNNWNNVNIYYYSGNLEGTSWTGTPMFADGDGWYLYKIYGLEQARVLFNNGSGTQIPGVMEEGFLVSDEMWYRNGTWTDERPDEITVFFYKPDNWSPANIYYYLNDNDTGPVWPGTTMTEVSDGWYVYHITKYASAKVMFNDGSNQIPAQNLPGLDASGIMWYKDGVWCDSETDTDEDELPDYMELILGTNINNTDTDNDSLPDGFEVLTLGTDPLKADSDNDGTNDANEDADGDGLTNLREYQLGTEPLDEDTDQDGLTDGDEVNTYFTDPKDKDTDGDTLSDSDDIALGFSPLLPDTDANGVLDCDEKIFQTLSEEISESEKPEVTDVTVSFSGTGNIHTNTTIKSIYNVDIMSSNVVGLVGAPVEIETSSDFDTATITFTYDPSELDDTDEDDLSVMWYDEENDWYHILDQESVVDKINHTVSVTTTHFSKYMLVDSQEWYQRWKNQIEYQRGSNRGFHFTFVVDVSGSMSGYRLTKAKEALNNFADQFDTYDTKSLVSFNSSAQICSYIHETTAEFKQAVNNLTAGGGTSVSAGLNLGVSDVASRDSSQDKIVILLCDGDVDDCSGIVDYCAFNHIKIFTINVVNANSESLQNIAESTGGEYYQAKDAADIGSIMKHINVDIDKTDNDEDGLPDILEEQGMLTVNGHVFTSSSETKHSDKDELTDGEEMGVHFGERLENYVRIKYEYIGYGEFAYCFYFDAKSDPENEDSDGDGILDSDDFWEANTIWSEDNPSDLRYKALDPMVKNTLETLYPDINKYNDTKNAHYITVSDNTINLRTYVTFPTTDAYKVFPGTDFTYAQVIENGIESRWTTELLGSEYDFVKGMKIKVNMNIIPIECLPLFDTQRYIQINVYDYFDIPRTIYEQFFWHTVRNISHPGYINMYTGDSRNDHLYNYIEYQGTVAHEFGHTLLLGDAYFSSPITGNQLTSNDEIAQGNFGCDGSIMYSNGKVYANDIEMVLEAFIKNSSQDYYTMLANSEHGELTKSNVIRHSQVFDGNP